MSARYWLAKYVEAPARNEARNVGVIVDLAGVLSAKFVGERDDGVFDRRRVANFQYPSVYSQWRDYWRNRIEHRKLDEILTSPTVNYFLESGGEVADVGADTSDEVCQFLFDLLVGNGPVSAYRWEVNDGEVALSLDIAAAFRARNLLVVGQLLVRHPVKEGETISGQHVRHRPSFSQRNGALSVFEHIDLAAPQYNKVKERAGWIGYMFSDIKARDPLASAYSLVRTETSGHGEAIDYARNVLGAESTVIDWANDNERNGFLAERVKMADSI